MFSQFLSVLFRTLAALLLVTASGCSVYMAAKQPDQKELSVLRQGTPRVNVIAELGQPMWTDEKDGVKSDIFKFKQGYSPETKIARAVFHGAADVFTLGLWEVVATPTEAYFSGTDTTVRVTYDRDDRVKSAGPLNNDTLSPRDAR